MSHKCRQILEASLLKTGKITKPLTTADGKAQRRYWLNHTEALRAPNKFEAPLLTMIRSIADYADDHATRYGDNVGNDHYTGGECIIGMLRAWNGLLSCELGRLDGGVLSGAIGDLAEACGLDRDLNS
jgi:hypothetical protein